jgi:prepilin-type N-terminal cleavage/methylation domain-containing protein
VGRKKHQFHHHSLPGLGGFTLIELLIGIALSSILVVVLYELLTTQNRTYSLQDDAAEMQQNLRVAVEKISRDLMSTGFGKPAWSSINQADASAWYNSAAGWVPYQITTVGSNNAIDIVGCFESTVSHLNANAAVGATTLVLQAGEGANFNSTTRQDINMGSVENAKVTNVAGDTLTINHALVNFEPVGALVCVVKWVTYSVDNDNVLYVNEHQGQGNQPVAQDITAMTIGIAGKLVTVNMTGRTKNPDRTTGQYITSQVTNNVRLRN